MSAAWRSMTRRTAGARCIIDSYRLDTLIGRGGTDAIQLGILFAAFSRGVDYIRLPSDVSVSTLSIVERALTFDTWGWIFVALASAGYLGLFLARTPLTAIVHGFLVAVYVVFAVGALADVADQDVFYGWRTAVGWLAGAAVAHAVLFGASKDAWRRADAA